MVERNPQTKFQRNSSTGYGRDAITGKFQDGRRRPYLLLDRNQIMACTVSSLGEHPRQVSKKNRPVVSGEIR